MNVTPEPGCIALARQAATWKAAWEKTLRFHFLLAWTSLAMKAGQALIDDVKRATS